MSDWQRIICKQAITRQARAMLEQRVGTARKKPIQSNAA